MNDEYLLVNKVRFWSMFAIVLEHALLLSPITNFTHQMGVVMWFQLCKFGTICFFIISGFLIAEHNGESAYQYYRKRLKSIGLPWLFWCGFYVILLFVAELVHTRIYSLSDAALILFNGIFYSAYWFVANFLFSLAIMLLIKNRLKSNAILILLLIFSFLYGINLYFHWVPTAHTVSFGGYILFMYLGYLVRLHLSAVQNFIDKIPMLYFILIFVCCYSCCLIESYYLDVHVQELNYLSSLRISNQIYSLVMFFMLMKLPDDFYPAFLKPRKVTFGIYLTHPILLLAFSASWSRVFVKLGYGVDRIKVLSVVSSNLGSLFKFIFLGGNFILIYSLSYLIVFVLSRFNLGNLVGIK